MSCYGIIYSIGITVIAIFEMHSKLVYILLPKMYYKIKIPCRTRHGIYTHGNTS
ncbi:MAG: hypothetical protein IPK03_12735 [Bacteroidetes bacterium]|nr:hypothetical protein [Bacteroidota bacterium]